MKIDEIKLPEDWKDLIESLIEGRVGVFDDHHLQGQLFAAGYIDTPYSRRELGISATVKLVAWYETHKNDVVPKHPGTFTEWYAQLHPHFGLHESTPVAAERIARMAWDACKVRGEDID